MYKRAEKLEKILYGHENSRKFAHSKRLATTPPPICLKPSQGLGFSLFKLSKCPICKGLYNSCEFCIIQTSQFFSVKKYVINKERSFV